MLFSRPIMSKWWNKVHLKFHYSKGYRINYPVGIRKFGSEEATTVFSLESVLFFRN